MYLDFEPGNHLNEMRGMPLRAEAPLRGLEGE